MDMDEMIGHCVFCPENLLEINNLPKQFFS